MTRAEVRCLTDWATQAPLECCFFTIISILSFNNMHMKFIIPFSVRFPFLNLSGLLIEKFLQICLPIFYPIVSNIWCNVSIKVFISLFCLILCEIYPVNLVTCSLLRLLFSYFFSHIKYKNLNFVSGNYSICCLSVSNSEFYFSCWTLLKMVSLIRDLMIPCCELIFPRTVSIEILWGPCAMRLQSRNNLYLYWKQSTWNHFKLFVAYSYLGHRAGMNSSPTPGWFLDLRLGILRGDCFLFSSQPRSKMRKGISSSMELFSSCSSTKDSWSHRDTQICTMLQLQAWSPGTVLPEIKLFHLCSCVFFLSSNFLSEHLKKLAQHIQKNNSWTQNGIFHSLINKMSQGQKRYHLLNSFNLSFLPSLLLLIFT